MVIVHLCEWREEQPRQTGELIYPSGSHIESSISLMCNCFFFFLLFPGMATDLRCSVWLQIAPGQWWPLPARSVRCGLQPPLTPGSPLRFSRTVKISTYFSCRNLPLHRLWFSDVDFDGILVHELMQFLIICVHFRHREVDYSSFF